ncbi:MAG: UTP--glucose-1-phosphate uridylyltransferase [Chloroflexi bacterium]|nr:UTP--glucose-1-phosphate uridylyltransferase [Chloroflexota bacterium]
MPSSALLDTILSPDPAVRDRSLRDLCVPLSLAELQAECAVLDSFRRSSTNLFERVRATAFLYAIYRFHLPRRLAAAPAGRIPYGGYAHLLERRFEEAIDAFLAASRREGPSEALASGLAQAYHLLAFQTLADQVRRSVRSFAGNRWMFRMGHPADHPLRVHPLLLRRDPATGLFPVVAEFTPVRMDLTHSGWSDIFFLGMDYPEGARVINVSVDLAVRGRDPAPQPPVSAYVRVIDKPLLRLASLDLGAQAEIRTVGEVFDFARDYLGLLKAAVIAAGIVPPGLEGAGHPLSDLLARVVGPGMGIELVSEVRGIPKGSRLAVSTTLLAALIAALMRGTGQVSTLEGPLREDERRQVAARAVLGEWLAGSGGGWQDSGGVWPGIKLIHGVQAQDGDPEYGVSRGRLLPEHVILGPDKVRPQMRQALQDSLVLVHGGMAQNVGPILEMVTERYLLRSPQEWSARKEAGAILDHVLELLRSGSVPELAQATTHNFTGPLQTIVPWASNLYVESLIERARTDLGEAFWGFWMLGGMSGGGMGFMVAPEARDAAQGYLLEMMHEEKRRLEHALPFAMDPVVYDFSINEVGSAARLLQGEAALLPGSYYSLAVPRLLKQSRHDLSESQRAELDLFSRAVRTRPEMLPAMGLLLDALLPQSEAPREGQQDLDRLLDENGFDRQQHEQIRRELRAGIIGLAQNRLPATSEIRDVAPGDVHRAPEGNAHLERVGLEALARGAAAVVTLAGGVGSRWTQGAGVVKAINPFARLGGAQRTFLEVHLAKSARTAELAGAPLAHVITTSYLTHGPIAEYLGRCGNYGYRGPLYLSQGRAIGLRLVPMVRDLRFAWEELSQQLLDEQAQKVRESLNAALIAWAEGMGEGRDYRDNLALQCLSPIGHWYEIPNLFRSGVLARLLEAQPGLQYLLVHNIDTLGASLDPTLLGMMIEHQVPFAVEVVPHRIQDRGGGLARVDGRLRLVEGLAIPREEQEFDLTYYNSNTFWLQVDRLLELFGLDRATLRDAEAVETATREMARRMPTYVTLKDVKRRWGNGQEDVYPVAQYEKLWGDMTALPEWQGIYLAVSTNRGQQLKERDQLDGWFRDGSAEQIETLCGWR